MSMVRSLLVVLALVIGAGQAVAESRVAINDGPALRLIGSIEGPDGYNDIFRGSPIRPGKPVVMMTIGEVLDFQDRMVARGSRSSAIGKYQFIRKTLRYLVERHGIDKNQKFDQRTQDYLARIMLASCGFYNSDQDINALGNCLSRVWAALPVMTGSNRGKSYYNNIAGNRALTTTDVVRQVLSARLENVRTPLEAEIIGRYASGRTAPARASAPRSYAYAQATPMVFPDDGRFADRVPLLAR